MGHDYALFLGQFHLPCWAVLVTYHLLSSHGSVWLQSGARTNPAAGLSFPAVDVKALNLAKTFKGHVMSVSSLAMHPTKPIVVCLNAALMMESLSQLYNCCCVKAACNLCRENSQTLPLLGAFCQRPWID